MDLEDSVEIGDLVSKINSNPQHLDALFNEADKHGNRDVLEAIWVEDTSREQFLQDQLTNSMSSVVEACDTELPSCVCTCTGTGSKLNRWSLVTYRIGMCAYVCVMWYWCFYRCVYVCMCTCVCYVIMIINSSSCDICEKSCCL